MRIAAATVVLLLLPFLAQAGPLNTFLPSVHAAPRQRIQSTASEALEMSIKTEAAASVNAIRQISNTDNLSAGDGETGPGVRLGSRLEE